MLALAIVASLQAAENTEPPLEVLYAPANLLVSGKLIEIKPAGRLVFAFDQLLSGKSTPPARIDVRVPKPTLAEARTGQRYIFAYCLYRQDPIRPDRAIYNRDGAVMLVEPGLEPALFQDNRATRSILKASRDEEAEESGRLLRLLLEALRGNDRALQNLSANQIALEPDLRGHLRESDRTMIETLVLDKRAMPAARTALLLVASRNPGRFGGWWRGAAQKILATTPAGGYADAASDPTGLVLTAFEILELHKVEFLSNALGRWVESGSPILAEHALLAMRKQTPAAERPAIEKALANPALPAVTRKFLNDHLRRLNLLEARLRERKEGSR